VTFNLSPDPVHPPVPDAPTATAPLGGRGTYHFERGRYVSPIPAKILIDYRDRLRGPFEQRMHLFPKPNGSSLPCNPSMCRECWREEHWREHGAGDAS
jgi:hypothetical protein